MAIPQQTIDQILDRIDLVDVVGRHVKLKRSGKTFTACCPFHNEKSPSFHVDPNKGFYHCFGCQAHGNAIGFLMNYENRSFIDVIQELAQQANIELPKNRQESNDKFNYKRQPAKPVANPAPTKTATKPVAKKAETNNSDNSPLNNSQPAPGADYPPDVMDMHYADDNMLLDDPFFFAGSFDPAPDMGMPAEAAQDGNLYDLLEQVAAFYEKQLQQHVPAQNYLQSRGLTQQTINYWRLGYAPEGWQHLEQHFPQDIDGLKAVGLIREGDKGRAFDLLRDRVIFPIRDNKGRVVGFGGRAMNDEVKPKYINSPESVIFHKSNVLYGLFEGRKARASQWLMVEGYMDVIALQQAGLSGAVASLGTATNVEHLQTLFKQSHRITLAFDGDSAGQRAAWRTLELALPILNDGRELRFLVLPQQHDPDSLVRLEGLTQFSRRVEQAPPLSDFLFATLSQQIDISTPEGKSSLMNEARTLMSSLPQQGSFRRLLEQSLRERLGLGWRGKPAVQEQLLSFEQSCSLEEKALLLLLQYPPLFSHMVELIELADANHAFGRALYLMQQAEEELPDDPEQCLYFLLGAWPNDQERNKLCHLLDAVDMRTYVQQPERLEGLCQELILQLTEQYLTRKVSMAVSIKDSQQFKNQLLEVRKKLYFRDQVAS